MSLKQGQGNEPSATPMALVLDTTHNYHDSLPRHAVAATPSAGCASTGAATSM